MFDTLPPSFLNQIKDHISSSHRNGQDKWRFGNSDEDTLTGDYFGSFITKNGIVSSSREWEANFEYKKFRGRGQNAFEKISGADGIIQLNIIDKTNPFDSILFRKGLLFQAKKGKMSDPNLENQVALMERISKGSSIVLNYTKNGYRAISGQSTIEKGSSNLVNSDFLSFDRMLNEEYLECTIGKVDMYFDFISNDLKVTDLSGKIISYSTERARALNIEIVKSFNPLY